MKAEDFPIYFVIVLAVYVATLFVVLSSIGPALGSVIVAFAPFLVLLFLPAVLFGIYIYRYPTIWLRLTIIIIAAVSIVFSFVMLLPIM